MEQLNHKDTGIFCIHKIGITGFLAYDFKPISSNIVKNFICFVTSLRCQAIFRAKGDWGRIEYFILKSERIFC
jgi:hypothetical protein